MAEQNPGGGAQFKLLGLNSSISNCRAGIITFTGKPSHFKQWTKEIEKHALMFNSTPDEKRYLAFLSSEGAVSDCIMRFLQDETPPTWEVLIEQLRQRFGERLDRAQAASKLRKLEQKKGETAQVYAEKLLELARDAYPGQDLNNPIIQSHLVDIFTDGLVSEKVARQLIKTPPALLTDAAKSAAGEENTQRNLRLCGRVETPMESGVPSPRPVLFA